MADDKNIDAELIETDAHLRRALHAPQPPAGLSDRIYRATVGALPGEHRAVVGRIGWRRWVYAAAAAVLVGGMSLLLVTRMGPSDTATTTVATATSTDPLDTQLASTEQAIVAMDSSLDQNIDALSTDMDRIAGSFTGGNLAGYGSTSNDQTDLATEVFQVQNEMF
jgi:hypothetical protein